MQDKKTHPVAVVTGDPVIDWNIALYGADPFSLRLDSKSFATWHPGGALMLADLLGAIAEGIQPRFRILNTRAYKEVHDRLVKHRKAGTEAVFPEEEQFNHAYALFGQYEKDIWRVKTFLGFDDHLHRYLEPDASGAPSAVSPADDNQTRPDGRIGDLLHLERDNADADLVLIDDSDLGFRSHPELWPAALTEPGKEPWVLLRMVGRKIMEGELWKLLHARHQRKLIVVTTADYLRRGAQVPVSRGLSWERTAQDLARELQYNQRINPLSDCAYTVVTFPPIGAFLLSKRDGYQSRSIVFDSQLVEGMWEEQRCGHIAGYVSTMAGAIAHHLMRSLVKRDQELDMVEAVRSGLAAMRAIYETGFGQQSDSGRWRLAYPVRIAVAAYSSDDVKSERPIDHDRLTEGWVAREKRRFAVADVPPPFRENRAWAIMSSNEPGNLEAVAAKIARYGVDVGLRDVPRGEFGRLVTVDRQEIESYRSIRSLMTEYCSRSSETKPISIAVFGPPGCGKGFGVHELAKSLNLKIVPLEANVSQFASPSDLISALHRVRDEGLKGRVPLVFWDEFDTQLSGQRLGWLRYFLAPMQDGTFQEDDIAHHIGRSIFVFAGGTARTMEAFKSQFTREEFTAVKGPDFLSRLRGYIDLRGPNRVDAEDRFYIVRRAIVLRSLLQTHFPALFKTQQLVDDGERRTCQHMEIDNALLRAFLRVDEYKHGTRSIEAVVLMSRLAGRTFYEQSCLPSEAQIDLHVDGKNFLSEMESEAQTAGLGLEDSRDHRVTRAPVGPSRQNDSLWPGAHGGAT